MATAKKTSSAKIASATQPKEVAAETVRKRAPRKKTEATVANENTLTPTEGTTPTIKAIKNGKAQTTLSATAPWPFPTYSKP